MDEFDHVCVENRKGTAIVTLDQPETRNALNDKLIEELSDALRAAEADEETRQSC